MGIRSNLQLGTNFDRLFLVGTLHSVAMSLSVTIKMLKKYLFVLIISVLPELTKAQSLNGMTGLLNVPSADVQADGTFILGVNYLPEINQPVLGYNTGNYYFNLTFLPFLEVAYKLTILKLSNGTYNQDRGASFRLQPLKEKKYLPAVTIGVHDFFTTSSSGNQYFGATYIVSTKHFSLNSNNLGVTVGYGSDYLRHSQYVGLFGGISVAPSFLKPLKLMAEYDCKGINLGGSLLLFKHLYILSMAQHLNYFAGGIAYRAYL